MHYYRLMSMLPPLPEKPEASPISLSEVLEAFEQEMSGTDRATALAMLAHIDCQNVESLLQDRGEWDSRGPAPREAVEERKNLPEYLANFLEAYDSGSIPDEYPFDALWRGYCTFLMEMAAASGSVFLKEWVSFEISLRDALVHYRSENLGEKADSRLSGVPEQGSDSHVDLIASLHEIRSPMEQQRVLDRARLQKIESVAGIAPFTTDAAYAYLAAILILDRWDVSAEADAAKMLEVFA